METGKKCSNCGNWLRFVKREYVQLGKTGWVYGDIPNLLAGALDVEIWCCGECGKLEFYRAKDSGYDADFETDHIAQTTCPACGTNHDLDDPKCPFCGAKNPNI